MYKSSDAQLFNLHEQKFKMHTGHMHIAQQEVLGPFK